MEQLIKTVYEYPFTSFCTFLMVWILLQLIMNICEVIFLTKKDK